MSTAEWVHAGLPRAVLSLGEALGVSPERLERAMGLAPGTLSHPDPRLSPAHTRALWTALVAERPDEPLGLRVAQHLELAHFGLLGTLMQHSATLGEAMARSLRNQRLLSSGLRWRVTPLPDGHTALSLAVEPWQAELRHPVEALVLAGLATARALTRQRLVPRAVRFRHPRHAAAAEVEAFVGTQVEWGATTDGLVLGAEFFTTPVPHADAPVAEVLEGHARRVLSAREGGCEDGFSTRVREALRGTLRDGPPDEGDVARRLATSRRTLQRRLQAAGTSFAELVDEVRRSAALQLLADARLSVAEVSRELGFSEPSAFQRAFRRWTGVSPGAWRKERSAGSP